MSHISENGRFLHHRSMVRSNDIVKQDWLSLQPALKALRFYHINDHTVCQNSCLCVVYMYINISRRVVKSLRSSSAAASARQGQSHARLRPIFAAAACCSELGSKESFKFTLRLLFSCTASLSESVVGLCAHWRPHIT